jgi:hypothetical protein
VPGHPRDPADASTAASRDRRRIARATCSSAVARWAIDRRGRGSGRRAGHSRHCIGDWRLEGFPGTRREGRAVPRCRAADPVRSRSEEVHRPVRWRAGRRERRRLG